MRYYLSIHNMHKTHEDKLDSLARGYLKIWFNIQKNGVSDSSIFHPYMLGMKAPSQMYKEAHAGVHTMIRMKGDEVVNHALDSRIEREPRWTRKSSTICEARKILQDNIEDELVITAKGRTTGGTQLTPKAKELVATYKILKEEVKTFTKERYETLFSKEELIVSARKGSSDQIE